MHLDVTEAHAARMTEFMNQAAGPSFTATVSTTSSSTSHSSHSTPPSSQPSPDSRNSTATSLTPSDSGSGEFDLLTGPPPGVERYLLFCADSGEFHTTLENIRLTDVSDDGILWEKARQSYRRIRATRARTWSGKLQVRFSRARYFRFLEVMPLTLNQSLPSVSCTITYIRHLSNYSFDWNISRSRGLPSNVSATHPYRPWKK